MAILAAVSSVGFAMSADSVEAIPCGGEIQMYSDASKTVQIGAAGRTTDVPEECLCEFYTWGELSVHRTNNPSNFCQAP